MNARQFGRDSGDTYGRHALVNPGGDNVQRDVLHFIDSNYLGGMTYRIHPTRVTDNYVGAHRVIWYDVQSDGTRIGRNRALANDL